MKLLLIKNINNNLLVIHKTKWVNKSIRNIKELFLLRVFFSKFIFKFVWNLKYLVTLEFRTLYGFRRTFKFALELLNYLIKA